MSQVDSSKLSIGAVFVHNGTLYKLLDKDHVKLSKGGACMKLRCLNMQTGGVLNDLRVNVNETVEIVFVEKLILTYSHIYAGEAHFFDENMNFVEFPIEDLGTIGKLLEASAEVVEMPPIEISIINYRDNKSGEDTRKISNVRLASDAVTRVKETNPSIKGQTAKASLKQAIISAGGFKVWVPQYVNNNDKITVNYDESEDEFNFTGKLK